jgi:hypothetical protein
MLAAGEEAESTTEPAWALWRREYLSLQYGFDPTSSVIKNIVKTLHELNCSVSQNSSSSSYYCYYYYYYYYLLSFSEFLHLGPVSD